MVLVPVDANWEEAICSKCRITIPANAGDVFHPKGQRPYFLCAPCSLREGLRDPDWIDTALAQFPKKDALGKEKAPYPYQVIDARLIAVMRSILVNNEMGTGKTPTYILSLDPNMGHMIFCPTSVVTNWVEEGMFWRPDLQWEEAHNKRQWGLPEPGEVLVASYGLIPGDPCPKCKKKRRRACSHADSQLNPLPEVNRPLTLAADEIQYLQNRTVRRRKWDLLADRVMEAGGYLRGLTGTEVSNSPNDLLEITRCLRLDRYAWGTDEHFKHIFCEWYTRKKGQRTLPTGYARQELLHRLRPLRVCRLRKHVLKHLPPIQERRPIKVDLTPKIVKELDECVQKLLATRRAWDDVREGVIECPWGHYKGGKRTMVKLSDAEKDRRQGMFDQRVDMYFTTKPWETDTALREAIQECLDSKHTTPVIGELSKVRAMLSLVKVGAARELVELHEGRNQPFIVFCQHVAILDKLFADREGWGIYTGRISKAKRHQMVKDFQAGKIRNGLGVSILAGGEGITLTRAGSMLFIDEFWNPAKNRQARDRINRPGAEVHDSITIYRLVANHSVDRLLHTTLREKNALANSLKDEEWSKNGLVMA